MWRDAGVMVLGYGEASGGMVAGFGETSGGMVSGCGKASHGVVIRIRSGSRLGSFTLCRGFRRLFSFRH